MRKRLIIGITGTIGAGKGTVVDYLCSHHGFIHFSARKFLSEEIKRQGMPLNRDSMRTVANDLRKSHSPSYIVDQLLQSAKASNSPCVIESIRSEGEIESLRREGALLLAVDADVRRRYERVIERGSETDSVSFTKFMNDEAREMRSTSVFGQNLFACIAASDAVIFNDGTREDLNSETESAIGKLLDASKSTHLDNLKDSSAWLQQKAEWPASKQQLQQSR